MEIFLNQKSIIEEELSCLKILKSTKIEYICKNCQKRIKTIYKYFSKIKNQHLCKTCKMKLKIKEKYGVDNISQLAETKNKVKTTNLKKYGGHPQQNKEIQKRIQQINLKKYGVESPAQNKEIQKKTQQTNLKKYGVENVFKNKTIQNKIKQTNLKKYGVKNIQQNIEIHKKTQQTNLKKYGTKIPSQNKEIQKKTQQTNLKKYGVENVFGNKTIQNKIKHTNLKKYGTAFPQQNKEIQEKIKQTNLIKYYKSLFINEKFINKIIPLFKIDEYKGINFNNKYPWQCKKCNTQFEDDLYAGRIPRCPICFPKLNGISQYEKEILEWLKSLNIETKENNRFIISPLELDIFLPEHNLAIEFDGLYWHSESYKNKNYHLNKTNLCKEKGIQLIHIYEDEWIEKQEIMKSIIKSKIGIYDQVVYAKKCKIKEIDNENFYEENHIQGNINSSINLGLFYKGQMVSEISFSKPRFNKKYDWEITRFCNKLNTKVIGSFGKLLLYFRKKYSGSIITYSDKRYFDGAIYKNNGFQQLNDSKPNYYYTDYKQRFSRLKSQKHKIPNVDTLLTEWQNMQLQGWDRIWDCGNYCFNLK